MDKNLVEMLGLFTVPKDIHIQTKAERDEEAQLLGAAKDFLNEDDLGDTKNGPETEAD